MYGRWMKEREETSVRVDGGGEEESLSSEGNGGWEGKSWAAAEEPLQPELIYFFNTSHSSSDKEISPSAGMFMILLT